MTDRLRLRHAVLPMLVMGGFVLSAPVLAQAGSSAPVVYKDYPSWSAFPTPPQNVPTVVQIRTQVVALERVAGQLQSTADGLPWELNDPERLSASARAKIDPVLGAPITERANTAVIEAFAQRLRKRADPPPVAK